MTEHDAGAERQWLKHIGGLLGQARKSAGYSLKKISEATGISSSHILRMESGEQDFTVTKFARLAEALGIPVGLPLESALFYTRTLGPAAGNAPSEIGKLVSDMIGGVWEGKAISSKKSDLLAKIGEPLLLLIGDICKVTEALLLSSNPQLLARQMKFSFSPVAVTLTAFASTLDPTASLAERLSVIRSIKARPVRRLRSLGIIDGDLIEEFIEWAARNVYYEPMFNVTHFLLSEPEPADKQNDSLERVAEPLKRRADKCQETLDNRQIHSDSGGVRKSIRNLKELVIHLKGVTKPRGAKAALAREFRVSRQAVDQWLSGESSPSADIAIRLLHWKPKQPAK